MTIWVNENGRMRDTGVFSMRELEAMHAAHRETVDARCPFYFDDLQRCERDAGHEGAHMWHVGSVQRTAEPSP